jgi:hypothetical protein
LKDLEQHKKIAVLIDADNAQIGMQRRKGVICDLGPSVGGGREESRLARIGQAQ